MTRVRRRRIVGAVVVELSAYRRAVAVCRFTHLADDDVLVAVQDLWRTAHWNRARTGFARWRLVTCKVAVAADGAGETDVRRFATTTAGGRVAAVVTVFTGATIVLVYSGVVVVETGFESKRVVVSSAEVVEVPLADEVAFSRHSDDLSKAMPQKII